MDLTARYPTLPPVYVTGIGGAFDDQHVDGACQPDLHRIAYLDGHLDAVDRGHRRSGCDVRGYFHWSLLDSWEWAEGFTRRFGLVRVGDDLERHPRASFGRTARSSMAGADDRGTPVRTSTVPTART